MDKSTGHRPDIDGLRAIAILPVVLYHARIPGFSGGFVGVDIFFVISGYLITYLIIRDLDGGRFTFSNFWLRRARRILPAATIVMLAGLAIGWFYLLPNDYRRAGQSAFAESLFASNIYFWSKTGYFFDPAETMPFLHTWSLAVEEQFYWLFPLLLVGLTRYARPYRAWILGALLLVSLVYSGWAVNKQPEAAFYFPHSRAWELLIGAVTALYAYRSRRLNPPPAPLREVLSVAGALAIAYAVTQYDRNTPFPGAAAVVPCLGSALIILSNHHAPTAVGRLLSLPPLVWIGLISYSLYLWHWPLLVFAKYSSVNELSKAHLLVLLSIAVVLSWLSYRWIETPVRRQRILRRPRDFVAVALTVTVAVAAAGVSIHLANGVPARLPPAVYKAYNDAFAVGPECSDIVLSRNLSACTSARRDPIPDLIVWGDSHATKTMPIIHDLAQEKHLTVWKYLCHPVLDIYPVLEAKSVASSGCAESNAALLDFIRKNGVRNILFVSYWSQYTEGRDILMEGPGKRDPFYGDATTRPSSVDEARRVFRTHFIETVKTLHDLGVNVWILKEVPTHRYWVPNQLGKVLLFGGDPNEIGRPFSELAARRTFVDSVFEEVAGLGVVVLDPVPTLCSDSGFCRAVDHGRALYSDYNHVTVFGASKLQPIFEPMLAAVSAQKRSPSAPISQFMIDGSQPVVR